MLPSRAVGPTWLNNERQHGIPPVAACTDVTRMYQFPIQAPDRQIHHTCASKSSSQSSSQNTRMPHKSPPNMYRLRRTTWAQLALLNEQGHSATGTIAKTPSNSHSNARFKLSPTPLCTHPLDMQALTLRKYCMFVLLAWRREFTLAS